MKRVLAVAMVVVSVGLAGCSTDPRVTPGPTVTQTDTETQTTQIYSTVTARPTIEKVIATKTRTETETLTPTYDEYGEGTYVVGEDIKPGRYYTEGGSICYWARLGSLDTSDIKDNNAAGGPQTVRVERSDDAFQVRGDCTFGKR